MATSKHLGFVLLVAHTIAVLLYVGPSLKAFASIACLLLVWPWLTIARISNAVHAAHQMCRKTTADTEKDDRTHKPGGLYNEGNTCFMNSVLQSFASLDELHADLALHQLDQRYPMESELAQLLRRLNDMRTKTHTYSTALLVKLLGERVSRWDGYQQEDAQEFFQQLIDIIEKDKSREAQDGTGTDGKGTNSKGTDGKSTDGKNSKDSLDLRTPFDGACAVRVGCLKCQESEGIRKGVISSVDLNLQSVCDTSSRISLVQLLHDYCKMETISSVECCRCSLVDYLQELRKRSLHAEPGSLSRLFEARIADLEQTLRDPVIDEAKYKALKPARIRALSDKSKQVMFVEPLPKILAIHINRSMFDLRTGFSRKLHSDVVFDTSLDLGPFVLASGREPDSECRLPSTTSPILYALKAIIIHYGSHNYGHYVCFRRTRDGGWWQISDHSVEAVSPAHVLRSCSGVFMLFYEKAHSLETELRLKLDAVVERRAFRADNDEGHGILTPTDSCASETETYATASPGESLPATPCEGVA